VKRLWTLSMAFISFIKATFRTRAETVVNSTFSYVFVLKPWFHVNKIILKNFRPEPPPSVDRAKIVFISGVVPS